MNFVPSEVIPYGVAASDEAEIYSCIEQCGRIAYKSEDKITETSAQTFVQHLKKLGHLSVLEHSNIVLKISTSKPKAYLSLLHDHLVVILKKRNIYHPCVLDNEHLFIAGNIRSWLETIDQLNQHDTIRYLGNKLYLYYPSLFPKIDFESNLDIDCSIFTKQQQATLLGSPNVSKEMLDLPVFIFKVICDRGITHELVRHRVFSFTQESTRYVNYKNKGFKFIRPEYVNEPENRVFGARLTMISHWYNQMLQEGIKPQFARDILPNLLKSDIVISGRWSDWQHFITLRAATNAHPRIQYIAKTIQEYFRKIGMVQ